MTDPEHSEKHTTLLSQIGPFEDFFRQNYARVCQVVYKYIRDAGKVEDLAQEIFTELWVKRDSIQIHTSLDAYLRRMAVSRALNYIRDTKKHNWDELDAGSEELQQSHYQEASALLQLEESELKALIDEAISKLPEKCRIVFLMSRQEEMSYTEISQQLDISIKTVENQIGKALKLLRAALAASRG